MRFKSFDDFILYLYGSTESTFTCVVGNNETGKTDFNLLQIERIHKLGLSEHFASNMKSLEADFDIPYINNFSDLKEYCEMVNPPGKRKIKRVIFFGSEIGKWMPRDQPWKNVEFIEDLQTVRKFGLSMLTDAIDRVDARVLHPRFFAGLFTKPYKNNKRFAVFEDWKTGEIHHFTDIPKTKIVYDTYESANFYMKPNTSERSEVYLNEDFKIVKVYYETGSWKKAGVRTQEGKRSLMKVLDYVFTRGIYPNDNPSTTDKHDSTSSDTE